MSSELGARDLDGERLQAIVVVARLYHIHGIRQREIGKRLNMSQARVSRILRQAEELGIVRTVVAVPEGLHCDLEEEVERGYDVAEVHVVDVPEVGCDFASLLGQAAARHMGEVLSSARVVGFTSWSRTLQEFALALPAVPRAGTEWVVEMLGDLGSPMLQHAAARSTQALATALGAEAVFLRTPGVVATLELREAASRDPHVQRALTLLDRLDLAFVGVGPPDIHSTLHAGDSYFSPVQLAEVRTAGASGQLNQRFVDEDGRRLDTPLDALVVGSTLAQVAAAGRRVVIAGGADKQAAIAAALRGGWVDVLVTDLLTARFLLAEAPLRVGLARHHGAA